MSQFEDIEKKSLESLYTNLPNLFSTDNTTINLKNIQLKDLEVPSVGKILNDALLGVNLNNKLPVFTNVGTDSNLILVYDLDGKTTSIDRKDIYINELVLFKVNAINSDVLTVSINSERRPVYYKDEQVQPGMIWEDNIYGLTKVVDKYTLVYLSNNLDVLSLTNELVKQKLANIF